MNPSNKQSRPTIAPTVYYASIPDGGDFSPLFPTLRDEYVRNTVNERVKRERYYVWRLLEKAIFLSTGKSICDFEFTCSGGDGSGGKWSCSQFYFSLSHSKDAVAVAISDKRIGVDVEIIDGRNHFSIAKKILSQEEMEKLHTLSTEKQMDYVIKKWTAKESLFKMGDDPLFSPKKQINDREFFTEIINLSGLRYALTVATDGFDTPKFRLVDKLWPLYGKF